MPQIEKIILVAVSDEQCALDRLMGDVIADRPVELPVWPEIKLEIAKLRVAIGPLNGVVLVGEIVEREAPGQRLLVHWVRDRQRVQFAGLVDRLGADHMFDVRQFQQIAGFR